MSKTPSTSRSKKPASNRKRAATAPQPAVANPDSIAAPLDPMRRAMIAEAAYYRAERRGFAPGFELEDWLFSESELSAQAAAHIQQQRLRQSTPSSSELH